MMRPVRWMGIVLGSIGLIGSLGLGVLAAQEQPADAGAVKFPIAGLSYDTAEAIFKRHKGQLTRLPGAQGAGLGPEGIVVFTENPDALPVQLPGAEAVRLGLDGIHVHTTDPEALPKEVADVPIIAGPPYTTPIAGIPYRDARVIFARHEATLKQIPGVQEVQLARDGIVVYTEHPDLLPEELEEIPVKALPPMP